MSPADAGTRPERASLDYASSVLHGADYMIHPVHANHDAPCGNHTRVRSQSKMFPLRPVSVDPLGDADYEYCVAMRNNRCDAPVARRKVGALHTESNTAR